MRWLRGWPRMSSSPQHAREDVGSGCGPDVRSPMSAPSRTTWRQTSTDEKEVARRRALYKERLERALRHRSLGANLRDSATAGDGAVGNASHLIDAECAASSCADDSLWSAESAALAESAAPAVSAAPAESAAPAYPRHVAKRYVIRFRCK
jgi:hypothetical protein